jgi:hypothetical protein
MPQTGIPAEIQTGPSPLDSMDLRSKKAFRASGIKLWSDINPIHLIVKEYNDHKTIPQAVGLTAGRTAHEYNWRKHRKGVFMVDRYHSTAVDTIEHILWCRVTALILLSECPLSAFQLSFP